ncbi:MAG: ATP-binding protein [Clostridia bacterium]|jgi:signal transduction histidine kinase|nr:ATP-binding protein [Clostridia bacterium]
MRRLRSRLTLSFTLLILFTVTLISLFSNVLINKQFEQYMAQQQKIKAQSIADSLSLVYHPALSDWDVDAIHTLGMYALNEGYVLEVFDANGRLIWDARNHDMTLCLEIMQDISARMHRHGMTGEFTAREYVIEQNGQPIGTALISFFGPVFFSEEDMFFLGTLNTVLAVIGLVSLLMAVLVAGIWARRLSRPIARTADIATQIASGNYNIQFDEKPQTQELHVLATAINHLAASLARQENFRRRLTADVAHELRTPLATLRSHLEAMMLGVWAPTPERLKSVHEEILRLNTLVADLEHIERVESENLTLNKAPADLLELLRLVCGNFDGELQKKNLRFSIEGSRSVVNIDRDRISGVIANLMSNAIKYTPENGAIRVYVQDSDNAGIFIIEDNGAGIPEEELPHIFERFYRADKSRNRNTGGAGLGLAIVKSIVAAHQGSVSVKSEPNRGSSFIVTLPK